MPRTATSLAATNRTAAATPARTLPTALALAAFAALVLIGLCGCFERSPPATAIDTVRSPSLSDPSPNTRANTESPYYLRHDPF
jgi:hypothetical protein